jgi:tRNA modification GTPase
VLQDAWSLNVGKNRLPNESTIAAIATPLGAGGIGVIRISGENALAIATLLSTRRSLTPRMAHLCTLSDPKTKTTLDEAVVLYYKEPHSFTGEDVVELQCHGSMLILERLLQIIIANGARLAKRGEFSKRAFLNGKLSLTEAESIIDLIESQSEKAHDISIHHYKGALHKKIQSLRQGLMRCLEQVEASIDFPDEVPPIPKDLLIKAVQSALDFTQTVLKNKDFGAYIFSGVNGLIIGSPNAGKSSLLNALIGENRAIVSSTPGTTRDYIESQITLGGLKFKLTDTAGLRHAVDHIESEGIEKIQALLKSAHAIFWVIDSSNEFPENTPQLINMARAIPHRYILLNKWDLNPHQIPIDHPNFEGFTVHPLSAQTGEGIDAFKTQLSHDFVHTTENLDEATLCNIRQIHCFESVKEELDELKRTVDAGYEDDLLAINIKSAVEKLDEITGDRITEEVLDGVFHRFCVGK